MARRGFFVSDTLRSAIGQADGGIAQHLLMADPEGLDPPLLSAGQGDEEAQFDQLGLGEMAMEIGPELVVGNVGIPKDGAGVAEGGLLPLVKSIRVLELKELVVISFG